MHLELNEEERQALLEVLNHAIPNLREEVYKTENFDFREELKQRELVLRNLLARLMAAQEALK